MILDLLQYVGTFLGVASLVLITFKPTYVVTGFVMSAISCLFLSIWGVLSMNYGIAVSQTIYVVLYSVAAYNWFKIKIGDSK
jgi:uncharacterized membrane protein